MFAWSSAADRHRLPRVAAATVIIAAAVLWARPATAGGGAICSDRQPTTSASNEVLIKNACFRSTITHVAVGDRVTFTNKDVFAHNVVGWSADWGHLGELAQNRSFAVVFDRRGIYPYACYLHAGMTGAVVVGNKLVGGSRGGAVPLASTDTRGASALGEGQSPSSPVSGGGRGEILLAAALGLATIGAIVAVRLRRRPDKAPAETSS